MFTLEFRINGMLVGVVYGHNERDLSADTCEYSYHYHEVDKGNILSGHVVHVREDGLAKLCQKILTDAERQTN